MNRELLINAVGCIDSAIIDEAENYRPMRKNRKKSVWIWAAAAAACLCVTVMLVSRISFKHEMNAELIICFAGEAMHGYVDYREIAETGKVTITDELETLMNEHKGSEYRFAVRVIDANGADRAKIYDACIAPLDLRDPNGDNRESFLNSGVISELTRKQVYAIKSSPEFALIISPAALKINEEYPNTTDRGKLDVYVFPKNEVLELRNRYEDDDAWHNACKERALELLDEFSEEYGIRREELKDHRDITGTFRAELDTELIARLLKDERVKFVYVIDTME